MGIDQVTASGGGRPPRPVAGQRFFIVGGAGFVGSHFTDHLLGPGGAAAVTLYDNFSSGREWHYAHHTSDARFHVVRGEVEDTEALVRALEGHDVVIHLASNPDIARAAREPTIDFWQGTALTNSVVEAMRRTSARRILYASGSGVYGDLGTHEAEEDHGPLLPVSTYGASKLAGENLIGSYAYMFGLSGCAFRFGNVVGPRQTHGVGFDFARRLLEAAQAGASPVVLRILGDGTQSKSYVHISDIVRAVLMAHEKTEQDFQVFNVATGDYITVTEIAELAVGCVELPRARVTFDYAGGDRGWKGDVPVVRLNTDRIRALGWKNALSTREALRQSMLAMIPDMRSGRMSSAF
jgi:UDP-glucose 4-epimerase